MNKEQYESYIINVPDYPKKGVVFKDLTYLWQEKFSEVINDLSSLISWDQIDAVVGVESRGFILGSALAQKNNVGFIPIRKKGKLPPPVLSQSYSLEYGFDTIELKRSLRPKRVVLVDDVLATGGTLKASLSLCEKNHFQVKDILMLINLTFLNNLKDQLPNLHSVLEY